MARLVMRMRTREEMTAGMTAEEIETMDANEEIRRKAFDELREFEDALERND